MAAPRPDHRPEPAGAVRPAGLAGVPGARGTRATTSRWSAPRATAIRLPGRSTASDCTSTGRTRRAAAGRASSPSTRTRSWRRPGWRLKARRQGRFRRHPGLQPAGHLLAARAGLAVCRRHPVRLRPPRPVPRALRVPVPAGRPLALPGCCGARAHARTAPPTMSSRPTSPTRSIAIGRSGKAARDVTVVRTGPDPEPAAAAAPTPRAARGAGGTSPRTSA